MATEARDSGRVDGGFRLDFSDSDAVVLPGVWSDAAPQSGADGAMPAMTFTGSPSLGPAAPCFEAGALRCVAPGTSPRQRCDQGVWRTSDPCENGSVCDPASPAICRPVDPFCAGRSGGAVCDGAVMHVCAEAGFAREQISCASPEQCQLGLTTGECAACKPGSLRCAGAKLEACQPDGHSWALRESCGSPALCKPSAGGCTTGVCVAGARICVGETLRVCSADLTAFVSEKVCDFRCDEAGKQCDVCTANERSCDGDRVRSCSADGQHETFAVCARERPFCVGQGQCVQCKTESHCPAPSEACQVATCANGTCGFVAKPGPHPAEVKDGQDNNCNGMADEEICGDGIDNDGDGYADEGSSGLFAGGFLADRQVREQYGTCIEP